VAAEERGWRRPELVIEAGQLRRVARPGRARALARVLRKARGFDFEGELDEELLRSAGYDGTHVYCADLFRARLTRVELHEILVDHIVGGTAERPVVGTDRAWRLPGISNQLAEGLRRLPFPPQGKADGKAGPAIRKLAGRGYGEHLPKWLLDFAQGHYAASAAGPVQKDPGVETQPALPTAQGPEVAAGVDKPGPKPGVSGKVRVGQLADAILGDEKTRPANKRGWKAALARLILEKMVAEGYSHQFDSVTRDLRLLQLEYPETG
jgi:hypothetical protein